MSAALMEKQPAPQSEKKYRILARNLLMLTVSDEAIATLARLVPEHHVPKMDDHHPDAICFSSETQVTVDATSQDEQGSGRPAASFTVIIALHPINDTIGCIIGGEPILLDTTSYTRKEMREWQERLSKDNAQRGIVTPAEFAKSLESDDFNIHTSQEIDALSRAQCDGKSFKGYKKNDQAGAIVYEGRGLAHQIRLALTEDERAAGLTMTYLEKMVRAQDSDAALAMLYIMGVLAPPAPLKQREFAGGWIDFDDVTDKIGWYPQTTIDRRKMHGRIWEFVRYGERAQISGKRVGARYKDADGNEIDTTIDGAAWRVMKTEVPTQQSRYPISDIPIRAQIVMSQELTTLIIAPSTAQYLPMAEVLGAIPGGKPAGAWARVIGLAFVSFWRRNPREVVADILKPTRRELLSHFAAKVAPYDEILSSSDPIRAIKYWCAALHILADAGFIERSGEAAITFEEMKERVIENLSRQGWQEKWLDETVTIKPGLATMKPAIEERAKALPELKPRDLKAKPRKRKPTEKLIKNFGS